MRQDSKTVLKYVHVTDYVEIGAKGHKDAVSDAYDLSIVMERK